jgi:hypothetical protein
VGAEDEDAKEFGTLWETTSDLSQHDFPYMAAEDAFMEQCWEPSNYAPHFHNQGNFV